MTPSEHQARILGPALAVLFTPYLDAQSIFLVAIFVVVFTTLIGLFAPLKLKMILF